MERSLKQTVADPTYLEFFGLTQPPFAPLADSSQLFFAEQYALLGEHLENATTNADSLVVICGAGGSGKSTLLDHHVSRIGHHVYCVAIDESCKDEEQFYATVLNQIGFEDITGTVHELKNITREFLVCRGIAGDHVLILFDNAHLADPKILQQLRWLCDLKIKDQRVLSIVLAGNGDLVRIVNAPAMREAKFRSHVVFNIRAYTEEETASYVWHRLRLAGGNAGVKLPQEAYARIHRYSGGIPRLINTLCDEMLAHAHELETRVISEQIVRSVADKQQLLPHVIPLHGRGRRRTDPDFDRNQAVTEEEDAGPHEGSRASELAAETMQGESSVDLLRQIARLSERVEDLRADKKRALRDIDARNEDIIELREELAAKNEEAEELKRAIADDAEKILQTDLALRESASALQDSDNRSKQLAAELDKETSARQAAEDELSKAVAAAEKLRRQKQELQATVGDLDAKLDVANERIVHLESLDKDLADLDVELGGKTAELEQERRARKSAENELADARETVDRLEQARQELQAMVEDLKADLAFGLDVADERAAEIEALEKDAKDLAAELEAKSGDLESRRDELAADLERERHKREAAESEAAKATATVDELKQLNQELRARVDELSADLRQAGEQAIDAHSLDRKLSALEDEVGKAVRELALRDRAAAKPEQRLAASRNESDAPDTPGPGEAAAARFEESVYCRPAYQMLRKYDPGSYDRLISRYEQLAGGELTEKQVRDALRSEQAELMQRLLPKASDDAILAYAGLIVAQLDEFQLDGAEPCLTLLVPPSDPCGDELPVYSEKTREDELDVLDITLRTYSANRPVPAEKEVWPDLEPIFGGLFRAFGADNVAAMQNSYDPDIDRILVCNVSRALYSGILNLPKADAAKALRWLIST